MDTGEGIATALPILIHDLTANICARVFSNFDAVCRTDFNSAQIL
jgi:hypothetical protein